MMQKLLIIAALIACFFGFTTVSYSQEFPKPGTIIDKNNYKKYAHLFPPEALAMFETGLDGLMQPPTIHVVES